MKAPPINSPRGRRSGATFTDAGPQRTVTDPAATGAKKFYHVEITKP